VTTICTTPAARALQHRVQVVTEAFVAEVGADVDEFEFACHGRAW
jgi:hypothetical protein